VAGGEKSDRLRISPSLNNPYMRSGATNGLIVLAPSCSALPALRADKPRAIGFPGRAQVAPLRGSAGQTGRPRIRLCGYRRNLSGVARSCGSAPARRWKRRARGSRRYSPRHRCRRCARALKICDVARAHTASASAHVLHVFLLKVWPYSAAIRASWLTADSASSVSASSVFFSSCRVSSSRLAASFKPRCPAQAFSVP
jgi:hypothetical protein